MHIGEAFLEPLQGAAIAVMTEALDEVMHLEKLACSSLKKRLLSLITDTH